MLGYAGRPNNLDPLPRWMIARFLLGEAAPSITLVLISFGGVLCPPPHRPRSWIRLARIWRCTAMPTWFGRSLGHAAYSSCRVLPVARARTRSPRPRFRALGSRPADLLVADLGGRPRPRVALEAFASAAEADLGLLAGGVLLTRVSTRSASRDRSIEWQSLRGRHRGVQAAR